MTKLLIKVFFIQIFFIPQGQIYSQEWPQWRGPSRAGVLSTSEIPNTWPDNLKRIWQIDVGTGHASPIVSQNRIYIFDRRRGEEVVSRINPNDGKIVWQKAYPAPYTMHPAATGHGKGPKSTPAVSGDKLITFGISGILSCYDTESGKLNWQKDFSKQFKQTSPLYGTAMSPLAVNGLCIAHVGGHDDGALIAVDLQTGETKWQWNGDGPAYASPIIGDISGSRQVVTFSQKKIVAVDFATGALLWQIPFTTPWIQNCVTPVLYENDLILSGLSQGIMRIKVEQTNGGWTIKEIWKNSEVGCYMSTPVLFDDLILIFSNKRKGLYASLDASTGQVFWQSSGREGDNAALIRAGDLLLSLNSDAKLIVAQRKAQEFTLVKEYSVADSPTYAHPVIFDRKVLIKDKTTLALWSLN